LEILLLVKEERKEKQIKRNTKARNKDSSTVLEDEVG
jgi:hypothetical protein